MAWRFRALSVLSEHLCSVWRWMCLCLESRQLGLPTLNTWHFFLSLPQQTLTPKLITSLGTKKCQLSQSSWLAKDVKGIWERGKWVCCMIFLLRRTRIISPKGQDVLKGRKALWWLVLNADLAQSRITQKVGLWDIILIGNWHRKTRSILRSTIS